MNKILSVFIGLALMATAANAQVYNAQSMMTNSVIAGSLTNYYASVASLAALRNGNMTPPVEVGVQCQLTGSTGTNVQNVVFVFKRSVDGTTYNTIGDWRVTVPIYGTTNNTVVTNWNVGGVGYLQLYAVENVSTNYITNVACKVSIK